MYIKGKFKKKVRYRPILQEEIEESDTLLPTTEAEEVEIYVREDGIAGVKANGNSILNYTDKVYLTDMEMSKGDYIDDNPVKIVEPLHNTRGRLVCYSVTVGPM